MRDETGSYESEEAKSEQRQEAIEARTFDIEFQHEGKHYKGWVTPSEELNDEDKPRSFHVVLNELFFGNLSFNNNQWEADTQREHGLIQAAGMQIATHY